MKKTSILFLIVFLCWTCTGFDGCQPGSNYVTGIVTDSDGNPIEGAVVRVVYDYPDSVTQFNINMFTAAITDSNGAYKILCYALTGAYGMVEEGKVYAIKRDHEISKSADWIDLDTGPLMSCVGQHKQTINFTLDYNKWISSGVFTGRILEKGVPLERYTGNLVARLTLPMQDDNYGINEITVAEYVINSSTAYATGVYRIEGLDFGHYFFWPVGDCAGSYEVYISSANPVVTYPDWDYYYELGGE